MTFPMVYLPGIVTGMSGGLALVWPERFLDSVWVADDRMIVMGITVSLSFRMTKAAEVREQAYAA